MTSLIAWLKSKNTGGEPIIQYPMSTQTEQEKLDKRNKDRQNQPDKLRKDKTEEPKAEAKTATKDKPKKDKAKVKEANLNAAATIASERALKYNYPADATDEQKKTFRRQARAKLKHFTDLLEELKTSEEEGAKAKLKEAKKEMAAWEQETYTAEGIDAVESKEAA